MLFFLQIHPGQYAVLFIDDLYLHPQKVQIIGNHIKSQASSLFTGIAAHKGFIDMGKEFLIYM